jgi:phage tail sheath protein FI
MPIYTAPGVYYTVNDLSQYAAPTSPTTCGIVGPARKGPVLGKRNPSTRTYNGPVLITTPEEFINVFGTPSPDFQAPYAALLYLQQGRQLWFGRVAPAEAWVDTATGSLVVGRTYDVVGTGSVTHNSISHAAGTSFVAINTSYTESGSPLVVPRVALAADKVVDSILTVTAISEGAWGNNLAIKLVASSSGSNQMKLEIWEYLDSVDSVLRETWDNLDILSTSDNFYETRINGKSQYVFVQVAAGSDTQPAEVSSKTKLGTGTTQTKYLTAGSNGDFTRAGDYVVGSDGDLVSVGDLVGAEYSGYATGLAAFADKDLVDISMLGVPDSCAPEVLTALQTLVEARQDCLGIVHGPLGLNAAQIIAWHNAVSPYDSTSVKLTSNSLAAYWPWIEIFDPYNKRNVWVPPTGFVMQKLAYTDNTAEPWFAPAGVNRGKLFEALRVEFNATLGQREAMYGPGNGNAINPICNLPLDGITIYGQRTMQRTASSLDRINVRRMLFYVAKVLQRAVRGLVFEQNDAQLWAQFKMIVGPFMTDIKARRGVEQVKVICDETTNTAFRRNNNEMYGYVLLIPTKTAEKIVMNFSLFPSGASLEIPKIG